MGVSPSKNIRYPGSNVTRFSSASVDVPINAKNRSKASGMRYQDGPTSHRKPSSAKLPARPPTSSFFSITVTCTPCLASKPAVAKPPIPAPMITAELGGMINSFA